MKATKIAHTDVLDHFRRTKRDLPSKLDEQLKQSVINCCQYLLYLKVIKARKKYAFELTIVFVNNIYPSVHASFNFLIELIN